MAAVGCVGVIFILQYYTGLFSKDECSLDFLNRSVYVVV